MKYLTTKTLYNILQLDVLCVWRYVCIASYNSLVSKFLKQFIIIIIIIIIIFVSTTDPVQLRLEVRKLNLI